MKFNSERVAMFINRLMYDGKKSTATRLLYDAFELMDKRGDQPAIELFEQALKNVGPRVEVRPKRVGGTTYQVPYEVNNYRALTLAMRWLLASSRKRSGRSMSEKLANELMDAAKGQGAAVKRRDDTHRMADANRAFAHFSRY
jgi:small subunit ribosomal protein S7